MVDCGAYAGPQKNADLAEDLNRVIVAGAIAEAVNQAQMRVWPHVVKVDHVLLTQGALEATTIFELRDATLESAFIDGESTAKPGAGFADYIVTRWIWRLIWKTDIRVRPIDHPLPPNYGAKRRCDSS